MYHGGVGLDNSLAPSSSGIYILRRVFWNSLNFDIQHCSTV